MKSNRILKYLAIGVVLLLLAAAIGTLIWVQTGTYEAGETAAAALESSGSVRVSQDEWIVFQPERPTEFGLVFYPGGLVEAGAYAPALRMIAEEGVLVVITPMPLNLAILDSDAAQEVITQFSDIEHWIIAGHSLGGAAASIFAENHPSSVEALALWDSYPPDSSDLSDNDIMVLSIYGTINGVPNVDNFEEKKPLLPPDTLFVGIEGANHAQFGDYGPQKGDVAANISPEEQQDRVVELMLDIIEPLK